MRKLAAIMFTDIAGYTALMGEDEPKALQLLKHNRELLKPIIRQFRGEWLKEMGDGTLSSFASAVDAVNCALVIQRTLKDDPEFSLRIGIHIGDVVFEEGDVFGDGVNVASRLEPLAEPGCICVSEPVCDAIKNKPNIESEFLGEKTLKGVEHPIKAYAVTETRALRAEPTRPRAQPLGYRWWAGVAAVIATVIVVALVFWRNIPSKDTGEVMEERQGERSVAVLPFVNFSDSKDDEYFSDGVTEDIITHLTRIGDLRVTSRTTIMKYKGTDMSLRDIGKELGVSTILEGSVRRVGERVRIVSQLVDALTDEHIWAETYDRDLTDIFAIQSDVAQNIAIALEAKLSPGERQSIEHKPTDNTEAYDNYLRAREYEYLSSSESDLNIALELYEKATESDPTFAEAYAGLVKTRLLKYMQREEFKTQSEILKTVRNIFKSLYMEDVAEVINTPKGTTIIIDSRFAFESGSANLKPALLQFLDDLIFIMKDPHNLFPIAVEGHTDNLPPTGWIAEKYPSNWEFSQARAAVVVRYLQSIRGAGR